MKIVWNTAPESDNLVSNDFEGYKKKYEEGKQLFSAEPEQYKDCPEETPYYSIVGTTCIKCENEE